MAGVYGPSEAFHYFRGQHIAREPQVVLERAIVNQGADLLKA